jgi:hypothetical protein
MTSLNPNSSNNPLEQSQSFVGAWQLTDGKVAISVNLNCDSLALVTIQQSSFKNGAFIDNTQTSSYPVPSTAETYQVPVALAYFRVILQNVDIIDQTFCRLNSVLTNTITHGVDIRKLSAFADSDNVEIIGKDGTGTLRHILCDASGALITTPSAVAQDVLTTEKVTQVGSRGNMQVATFNPLAQTNIFNCTGYAEAILTYEDTSPLNTGDMLIFVRVNNVADTQVCIGKLIPVVNANGTNRYASTTLNLRSFNFIYVQNNSTTNTNTNCVISLFSY